MFLDNLYQYFIPEKYRASESDDYYQARAVVIVCFSVSLIILLFFANRIRLNGLFSLPALVLGSAAIAVIFVPFFFKVTESLRTTTIALILVLMALIMMLTFITGGPLSPSLVFIPAFPLGGIMFVSFRFGLIISSIFASYLVFLSWALLNGLLPDATMSVSTLALLHITCTIAVAIVFAVLGGLHLSWQKSMRSLLEKASSAKSEFLSGMSHELRTPLNSIMGFSDLLSRGFAGSTTEQQDEYIGNILESSKHMLTLINDLLDIAKIESGEIELKLERANLDLLITDSVQMLKEMAFTKKIKIELSLHDSIKDIFSYVDTTKFKQIVINLLSNAVKFSPENSTVRVDGRVNEGKIFIVVSDEGPGISPDNEEKVFQKFYQVNNEASNKTVGTGLGLPISRIFAELHGGTLKLRNSEVRGGACFELTIPHRRTAN